jgi:acetyl esterase/lipase
MSVFAIDMMARRRAGVSLIASSLLLAIALSPSAALSKSAENMSVRCAALLRAELADTTITSARAVPAGPFKARFMLREEQVPAHCRIQGRISPEPGSDIRFEVWMPLSGWNGRLYGLGNGGFAGTISSSPGLVETIQRGGAGVSTDTGHQSQSPAPAEDGSWAKGHPERIRDYGDRAIHLAAVNARALVADFYGKPPHHAYFASCSNGGRQALMEAQRFPEDYDGLIAGAPAYDFTGLTADLIWNTQAQQPAGAAIPASKVPAIQAAVLQACAAGAAERGALIDDPPSCKFDPHVLLCKGEDSNNCLTAPQVAALQKIYSGPRTSTGQQLYPGFPPSGAEVGTMPGSGWDGWILAPAGGQAHDPKYAAALLADFATRVQTDIEHFDFDRDYPVFKSELAPVLDATDADLGRFAARGGKLLLWHGWADPAIPPQHTIDYFDAVRTTLGDEMASRVLRLFMVPGVQHCIGGPGPNSFGQFTAPPPPADPHSDMSAALEQWVEKGVAPDDLIGRHATNALVGALDWRQADPDKSTLLCAFPKIAVLNGKGDPALASSYRCANAGAAMPSTPRVNADGTVNAAPLDIPFSNFSSPQARAAFVRLFAHPQKPAGNDIMTLRAFYDQFNIELAARAKQLYPVLIEPRVIGGVKTEVITPKDGVSASNRHRVLINLHGGAFMWGEGAGGEVESIPIANVGNIEVVTVAYREAPEFKFPAGSEDVAAVYRELLKTYKAENIGIYGCSAGGILTAESVAWFQKERLPRPGAVGTFCGSASAMGGDSAYLASPLTAQDPNPALASGALSFTPYFSSASTADPLVLPINSREVLAKFPPTLLIAGSRDFAASSLFRTQAALTDVGVDAELHVWDGLWHAFFVDPDLPESKEVYGVIVRFFDRHLGGR